MLFCCTTPQDAPPPMREKETDLLHHDTTHLWADARGTTVVIVPLPLSYGSRGAGLPKLVACAARGLGLTHTEVHFPLRRLPRGSTLTLTQEED